MGDDIDITVRTLEIIKLPEEVTVHNQDTIEVEAGSVRVRLRIKIDENISSTYFIASSDRTWATPQKREGELWLYIDANHSINQRMAEIVFTHPLCDECETAISIRQEGETYKTSFKRTLLGEEYPSASLYPIAYQDSDGTIIAAQTFDAELYVSGGARAFRIYVTKERWAETDDDDETQGGEWLPTKNDGGIVIGQWSKTGTAADGADIYSIPVTGYGSLDVGETTRYVVNVSHSDYPLTVNDKYYVAYDKETGQAGQANAVGKTEYKHISVLTKQKTVDYAKREIGSEVVIERPIQAPQVEQDNASKLPFLAMVESVGDTYSAIETPSTPQIIKQTWDIPSYEFLLAIGPSDTAIVQFSQSSDFISCGIELVARDIELEYGQRYKVSVFRITLSRDNDSLFVVSRYCKLHFASDAYPTLYMEMIAKAEPTVGQWTITLMPTENATIRVDRTESSQTEQKIVPKKRDNGDEVTVKEVL